jgi:hypothetical protein
MILCCRLSPKYFQLSLGFSGLTNIYIFDAHHNQTCSVITEISSAQGDKNSASSAQKNSHSWHKIMPQHCKKEVKTIQMTQKIKRRMHPLSARARDIFVHGAHMRGCGVQNPRACQTAHLWNWSASQPLMDRLPIRFDIKSELNPRGGAGQRPKCALKCLSSHSKGVA